MWGRAQREAARRRKSDWGKVCGGGLNTHGSKITWPELKCISIRKMRIVELSRSSVVPERPYVLQQFFILLFFIARSPRSVGRSPRNFVTWSKADLIYKCRKNLGPCSPLKKLGGAKNMLNLTRFRTPFHFEREYLRNG